MKPSYPRASINCIHIIEEVEGFSPTMYYDTGNLPTIGYGTLIDTEEEKYLVTALISRVEAEVLLRKDLDRFEAALRKMVQVQLTQNQWDALASFTYNVGTNQVRTSTLLRKLNKDPWDPTIPYEFGRWVYDDGRKQAGLVKRRKREADLYMNQLTV